ncbi:MAG TPA: hypothetical protein VGH65_09830 [Verrucomicrobiaceae bacterium]|jgi:hypothetical protein
MRWKWTGWLTACGVSALLLWHWHGDESAAPARVEARELLSALDRESDPQSPDNNYEWLINSSPTEARRMAILSRLRELGAPALAEVRDQRLRQHEIESSEMLTVAAAELGDKDAVLEAARIMVWSSFPAVRISASEVLCNLKDARTSDWFFLALDDDRSVHNDACNSQRELFYPVRATAQMALRDFGYSEENIAFRALETSGTDF